MDVYFPNPFPDDCVFHCEKIKSYELDIHPYELMISQSYKSDKRRNEFLTGRHCAHQTFRQIGFPDLPILKSRNRSPIWPFNIVGSISHGADLAAAIIRKLHSNICGIGIDIEDLSRKIRTNITDYVLTPWEVNRWIKNRKELTLETRLIFSIKESIYKCFQPIDRIALGFHDAEITDITQQSFTARLLKNPFKTESGLPLIVTGKVFVKNSIVLSAIKADISLLNQRK
ncbi:4'-phosphopantetheinyl transferase superfamily protein [bacterium]|nr:4'-phosphopantetheinyl transferase superfamily protein [bacterium]